MGADPARVTQPKKQAAGYLVQHTTGSWLRGLTELALHVASDISQREKALAKIGKLNFNNYFLHFVLTAPCVKLLHQVKRDINKRSG